MKLNSRRTFLRIVIAGISAFFVLVWNKLTLQQLQISSPGKSEFPYNKNKEISFPGSFIIVNKNNTPVVFSSHCTHLGCSINKVENDRLVCPCHGSEYDLSGKVVKGPAYKNLQTIPFHISDDGKNIIIEG
jgi:cytochrome b6-f complex iron-sulfur subunit